MIKRIFYRYTALTLLALFTFTGCEKNFDEINTNPNAVVDVPAIYFLPGSIESIADRINDSYEMFSSTSNWVQHIAMYNTWNPMQRFEIDKFRLFLFTSMYTGPLMDLTLMEKKAAEEDNDALLAIAKIVKAYGFLHVTDAFGDIPYSEAFRLEDDINKPVYDPQASIYADILDELTEANQLLAGSVSLVVADGYEPLYNGDVLKWRKFANSLKIRALMRASAKLDVAAELSAMISDPQTYPIFNTLQESAFYKYSGNGAGNDFPLASTFENSSPTGGIRISKTLVDHMTATGDPRLPKYATLNKDGEYVGLSHFIATTGEELPNQFSMLNDDLGQRDQQISMLEYPELMFLLAEARVKGLITTGDAEEYYNNAVAASCRKFGVAEADIETFLEEEVPFDGSLDLIYSQKWVSLFMQGHEAWAEYRRTGKPELQLPLNALYDVIPYRFYYPEAEDLLNKANKDAAAALLSNGDDLDSKIWWIE
jgi:hypothetical protein